MTTDLVVWAGPVAKFQVAGATVVGAKELFLGCCGDLTPPCTPPTCSTIGATLRAAPVDALLQGAKMVGADLGDLFFGAFSAGGSVIKRLMLVPAYRNITTAVLLADATYTGGWLDEKKALAPPIEGFVQYAVDVINGPGDKLFVATASPSPNKSFPTGMQNLAATRREIEKRTSKQFEELGSFFYGVEPAPERVCKLGNVIFADFPMEPLGHGHNRIAGQVWQKILYPWLAKGKGAIEAPGGLSPPPIPIPTEEPPTEESNPLRWLALAGGVVLGYVVVRRLMGRRR